MDCNKCKNKTCLETGKPCKKVEKLLKKENIYKTNYIRPMISSAKREKGLSHWREIPFSSLNDKAKRELGIDETYK